MRNLLMLGLMLWGSAGAVTLYTVTVKASEALDSMQVFIFPTGQKEGMKAYNFQKTASSASFKVPPGKYTVGAFQVKPIEREMDFSSMDIIVSKNGSYTVEVKKLPTFDTAAKNAWDDILISMGATAEGCNHPQINFMCASVDSSFDVVKGYIGLNDVFRQTGAWSHLDTFYTAPFRVNGVRLDITAMPDASSTFIVLARHH